jgi:AraC-like DNA-binding protein
MQRGVFLRLTDSGCPSAVYWSARLRSALLRKFFTASDPVVPIHHPRILVETAVALGAERAALLENVGITPATLEQADARISYEQLGTLERNAIRLTKDPSLGLRLGRANGFLNNGLVGVAAATSENLEAAFRLMKEYYLQTTPCWEFDLRAEGDRGFFTIRETIPRGDLRAFATEALLAAFHGLVKQAIGRDFAVRQVRLSYPRPEHWKLYAEYVVDCPLFFDEPVTEVEFDASILRVPIATADPVTRSVLVQYVATEAARSVPVDGAAAQVRKILLANGGRRMGLADVARALQTSARSLRRALSQMGTSYQAVAEEILRASAVERVRSGRVKVEHIARELGFTDARSFRRAFKRWTGRNPNDYRREIDQS